MSCEQNRLKMTQYTYNTDYIFLCLEYAKNMFHEKAQKGFKHTPYDELQGVLLINPDFPWVWTVEE